ncbi:MAG: DUF58 domain-containing protein [Pirellulales bacterium]
MSITANSNATTLPQGASSWVDPATLMRIKNLQLRAKRVVDGFHNGLHRSPLHGFSVEFSEYRRYSEGDDPKGIDWKLFARSDRFYIKKFEDETNRRCLLVVDQSKSMTYGNPSSKVDYTKMDYARTLAATFAYYLTLQRDAVGMMTFEADVKEMVPARFRTGQLKRMLGLLEKPSEGNATDLVRPLSQLAELAKQRSLVIVISDFLVPWQPLQVPLAFLRARHHEVMLLRVLDPTEIELDLKQPTMLRDLESGKEVYIDPMTAKQRYRERFDAHAAGLAKLAGQLGISLTSMTTDSPLELALFDLLSRQSQGKRSLRSYGMQRGGGA